MKLFRRHLAPLAGDSVSSLNLPRVRMGLLTKLNLLTIGLIFLTAISTAGYYLWQQWRDENLELRRRGSAALAMLAELAEYGLYTNNRAHVDAILDSLSANSDIAYAVVIDATGETIASRRIADSLGTTPPPALPADARLPTPGAIVTTELAIRGQRYIELIAPVGGTRTALAMGLGQGSADTVATGAGAARRAASRAVCTSCERRSTRTFTWLTLSSVAVVWRMIVLS